MIVPASLPRRDAGLTDCLGPCLALLALLVAAATVLLSGPSPARPAGPAYACTGVTTVASLRAPTTSAAVATSVERDDTSVEAADIEAPAEFGVLALHRVAVRVRRTAAIAYAEPAGPARPPSGTGSPHRPPRAA